MEEYNCLRCGGSNFEHWNKESYCTEHLIKLFGKGICDSCFGYKLNHAGNLSKCVHLLNLLTEEQFALFLYLKEETLNRLFRSFNDYNYIDDLGSFKSFVVREWEKRYGKS